jgi:septum formation protein
VSPPRPERPPLVLASASPRRRELLGVLGVPFEVIPSAYEEPSPETHPDPAAFARHLAEEKARDVARRHPEALVIGADTVVALGEHLYAKPVDSPDAERMLRELSGREHVVVTGVALARAGDTVRSFSVATRVRFRALLADEIRTYVGSLEPLDKAGAYAIQGLGGLLIEGIEGDYPNVVGLPLTPLALELRALDYEILGVSGDE